MDSSRRTWLWVTGTILLLAAIVAPNLMRSRITHQRLAAGFRPTEMAYLVPASTSQRAQPDAGVIGGALSDAPEKKVVHTAELALNVHNVEEASARIRSLTLQAKGEIDQVRAWSPSEQTRAGELHVRVPADALDPMLKQFKAAALDVSNEQIAATDVTRQFADNDARMRTLKAEEQQYLQILKQAKSVPDVLDVTEKLDAVRAHIEQLQTDINVMSHDIAMSAVSITLSQNAPEGRVLGNWHPLTNARRSLRSMVEDLGDWLDAIVSFVIFLPVIALWTLSLGVVAWIGWRLLRFVWQRRPRTPLAT